MKEYYKEFGIKETVAALYLQAGSTYGVYKHKQCQILYSTERRKTFQQMWHANIEKESDALIPSSVLWVNQTLAARECNNWQN